MVHKYITAFSLCLVPTTAFLFVPSLSHVTGPSKIGIAQQDGKYET